MRPVAPRRQAPRDMNKRVRDGMAVKDMSICEFVFFSYKFTKPRLNHSSLLYRGHFQVWVGMSSGSGHGFEEVEVECEK